MWNMVVRTIPKMIKTMISDHWISKDLAYLQRAGLVRFGKRSIDLMRVLASDT